MTYSKCIIHFRNGKTYMAEFAQETSVEDICNSVLPIYDYDYEECDDDEIDYRVILEKNYGRIKIYGGGYFVFDRGEVLGVEFI